MGDLLVIVRLRDPPAVAIVVLHRGPGLLARSFAEHLVTVQRTVPAVKVAHGRVQRARGIWQRHVQIIRIAESVRYGSITRGTVLQNYCGVVVAAILHVERTEDVLLQVIRIFLSRYLLDDDAQKDIPGVVVQPFFSGREVERLVFGQKQDFGRGQWNAHELRFGKLRVARVTGDAGSGGKQLVNGDGLS